MLCCSEATQRGVQVEGTLRTVIFTETINSCPCDPCILMVPVQTAVATKVDLPEQTRLLICHWWVTTLCAHSVWRSTLQLCWHYLLHLST